MWIELCKKNEGVKHKDDRMLVILLSLKECRLFQLVHLMLEGIRIICKGRGNILAKSRGERAAKCGFIKRRTLTEKRKYSI